MIHDLRTVAYEKIVIHGVADDGTKLAIEIDVCPWMYMEATISREQIEYVTDSTPIGVFSSVINEPSKISINGYAQKIDYIIQEPDDIEGGRWFDILTVE